MENYIINELNKNLDNKLISFHMPGHKMGSIYKKLGYSSIVEKIYQMDTTEIEGTDNLHSPEGIIKKSQERASKVFKSQKTYYLIDGSTCGIQASILATCNPKDKIIVNRDCHQSVINGCILGDIDPVYIKSKVNNKSVLTGVDIEDVKETIDNNLDAKAILITYPTYYGYTYDLKEICEYAHSKDIIVIVDEAHGSHLGLSEKLPNTAISEGADIVIQSTHKTLPSFTQSSMLHIQGNRVDTNKIDTMLRMIESSSPSYILLSSLELAVDIYEKHGRDLMQDLLKNINEFSDIFKTNLSINIDNRYDKTKLFISLENAGITGYDLEEILRKEYNIQVELSNYYGILIICTIGNTKNDFDALQNALEDIIYKYKSDNKLKNIKYPDNIPQKAITPREAFYKTKKSVKIEDSEGKICGENVVPYPPGISIISPGEVITKEIIDYIAICTEEGMNISGMKDKELKYIQVIENI